jgi:hypothetical protein
MKRCVHVIAKLKDVFIRMRDPEIPNPDKVPQ